MDEIDGKDLIVKRILVKHGRVMPGLPGFVPLGNGKTHCFCCGKALTDELSFARGVGPECIKEWGPYPGREWVEKHAKAFKRYLGQQKRKNLQPVSFDKWLDQREKKSRIKL